VGAIAYNVNSPRILHFHLSLIPMIRIHIHSQSHLAFFKTNRRSYAILLLMAGLTFHQPARAQSGSVTGTVKD
jgi:hypothetical protein